MLPYFLSFSGTQLEKQRNLPMKKADGLAFGLVACLFFFFISHILREL